jgi:hypothetical protein
MTCPATLTHASAGAQLSSLRWARCSCANSCANSCRSSCASRMSSGGVGPRRHWGFEAGVILTTRPPRGHSGSQDHTLSKPWPAGAQTTQSTTGRQPCRHQGSDDWRDQTTTTTNQAIARGGRENDQAGDDRSGVQG